MNILDSVWLVKMIKKSGKSPTARLLAIFDILADWADAPNIRDQLDAQINHSDTPDHLIDYLTEEAKQCGAQLPEMLAQQIYLIAMGALKEFGRSAEHANFEHAKLAAKALIKVQTEKELSKSKPYIYGLAATLTVCVIASALFVQKHNFSYFTKTDIASNPFSNLSESAKPTKATPSPRETAEMYASIEQMRNGDCHYLEALQIPDKHKKVYLENVVGGEVPNNSDDLAIAKEYLQKVQCNYTPMLMKNSTN